MDAESASWKKNLSLIHRRQTNGFGKENSSNMSHGESLVDRDYDQESLAFIDPAIQMFGSSTPKYKMKIHESPSTDSKRFTDSMKWDCQRSLSSHVDTQKIIDYRSNHINEQRDSVNMQTPTRNSISEIKSPPDVLNQHDSYGSDVVKTLDFNSSVDGDGTFIIAGSSLPLDYWRENSTEQDAVVSTSPVTPVGKGLAAPKSDVSPESEVLKQSSLQGDLKSKIPSSVGKSGTPGSSSRPSVSPTQSKHDSDFAHHLMTTLGDDTDCSIVDAHTEKSEQQMTTDSKKIAAEAPQSICLVASTPMQARTGAVVERSRTLTTPAPASVPDSARKTPVHKVSEGHRGDGGELHDEWKETITPQGKKYYYNRRTRMSAWVLPANAVFVNTSDNVQRIYVPREKIGNDDRSVEKDESKTQEEATTAIPRAQKQVASTSQKHTDFKSAKEAYVSKTTGAIMRDDVGTDKEVVKQADSVLRTPTRATRQRREGSPSSPQSTGRHQIYSPVGGLTTPSRNEHHPSTTHQGRSGNQAPSPGVAFMKRGSQSAGRLGSSSETSSSMAGVPGPSARFHSTTKLDTLKEECFDDASIHSARGIGVSCMDITSDEPQVFESRRLFNEDNSVTTAYSDSTREYGTSLFCPLCSVLMWEGDSDNSASIVAHMHRCAFKKDASKTLMLFEQSLRSVISLLNSTEDRNKSHGALPSTSVLTPIHERPFRPMLSTPASNTHTRVSSPHPESSVLTEASPLSLHPVGKIRDTNEKKSYTQLYENRAILMADSSPTRVRDDLSEASSSRISSVSSRSTRKVNERAHSAGPTTSASKSDAKRTPLPARNHSAISRQPPSISPALAKQVERMQNSEHQFVCPCCKSNAPKSREELLRHMRDCMGQIDAPDDDASLSTARTVPLLQVSPNKRGDVFSGVAEARTVCPYCGKPASKSALSSHLLGCKKRKESKLRAQVPAMSQSQKIPDRASSATSRRPQTIIESNLSKASSPGSASAKDASSRSRSTSRTTSPGSSSSAKNKRTSSERLVQVFRL